MELHLLEEDSGVGKNGKPIPVYRFDGSRRIVLGLEFVRRHVAGVATDLSGNVLSRFFTNHVSDNYEEVVASAADKLSQLREGVENQGCSVIGLGIAAPGPIDASGRALDSPYGFHDWKRMPLADDFQGALGLPTLLAKDTDLSALAEHLLGAGKAYDSLIYVKLDEGIGSGIIDRNRLFHGHGRLHTSLGHTTVELRGERCVCGNRGCLEAYARLSRIEELMNAMWDERSRHHILDDVTDYIAAGVANLVMLFGIEQVVIEGESIHVFPSLLGRLKSRIPSRAFPILDREIQIHKGVFERDVAAIGGSVWVAQAVLNDPETLRVAGLPNLSKSAPAIVL
jgi:predicted NBD/HSP70 family sugar kinase